MNGNCLVDTLKRCVGQTVTIFTTSGGISGSGFTGVLAFVGEDCIKLITSIGGAPSCPINSSCTHVNNTCSKKQNNRIYPYKKQNKNNNYYSNTNTKDDDSCNWLGSIAEIPICKIACFVHNAK